MDLYLIRHAQSANNAVPDSQRVPDPPITELGIEQATCLSEPAKQLQLTRLMTSPFLRTLETTKHFFQHTGLVPEVRVQLHEQGGCYAGHINKDPQPGMNQTEIREAFPKYEIEDGLSEEGWWRSQPWEDWEATGKRAEELLQRTIEEFGHTNERVGYVMHADIKVLFIRAIGGEAIEMPWNASISHVQINGSSVDLISYNNTEHLPAHLLTN